MEDTEKNLKESLIVLEEKSEARSTSSSGALSWEALFKETKRVGFIGGPLMAVTLSQFLLQVISTMMIGHLGELALSSTSIAISLSAVTGFSLLVSLSLYSVRICFSIMVFFFY